MPLINKVRIVNFAYNNDNRIIPDTMLDFKNQDTLITLQNGGGKSIMAQTIMQPILPLSSLGNNAKKRTFDKIFRKDKEPAYILIEWKLDNNAGYMTCGIAVKRTSGNEEDEEKKGSLDYYTFILDRAFTDLNITNLKLSTWDGTKLNIKDYYEAKDFIESKGGKVYKSDSEYYRNNLMSYNISPKEWKSIITKINGDEGGLLKLFENSITSKDLAVNWIIKTIKETLSSSTNIAELSEQTENHIKKARRRIEDRKNRELLNKYTDTLGEFNKEVLNLKEVSEKTAKAKETLYSLKYTVTGEIKKYEEQSVKLDSELVEIEAALKEVRLQIESKKYYKISDRKDALIEERDEIRRKVDALNEELEAKKRLLTSLKVAEINKGLSNNKEELQSYRARIDKLSMEASEIDRELNNLGFTINGIYEGQEDTIKESLKNSEDDLNKAASEMEDVKKSLDEESRKRDSLTKESMECKTKIEYLDRDITGILEKVEYTNMFLATSPEEIDKEIAGLDKKSSETEAKIEDNIKVLAELKAQREANDAKLISVREEITSLKSDDAVKKRDYEIYEETVGQLSDKLRDYSIEFSIKNKTAALLKLDTKAAELEGAIDRAQDDIKSCTDELKRLSSGGIEINQKFIDYLNEKGLNYTLGSDYVKGSVKDESLRRKLLEKVPFLPYAVIMEGETIDYIKSDMPSEYYENISLIIDRENLASFDFSGCHGIIEVGKGVNVLSLCNEDLVVKDDLEKEKQDLRTKINVLDSNVSSWKSQEKDLNIVRNEIENLQYDEEFERNIKAAIKEIEDKIASLEKSIEEINETIVILKDEENNFASENDKLKEELRNIEASREQFVSLKEKVIDKKEAYAKAESLKDDIKVSDEIIAYKKDKQEKLSSAINDYKTEKMKAESELDKLSFKRKSFRGYKEGTKVSGSIEELISRFENLKKDSSSDQLQEYKERAAKCEKEIEEDEKKLSSFREGEYDAVEYSFELEMATEKERESLIDKIANGSSQVAVRNTKISGLDQEMASIVNSIKPDTIRDRADIDSNLEEKQKTLLIRKDKTNEAMTDIKRKSEECTKLDGRISDSQWFDEKEYNLSSKVYNFKLLEDMENIYNAEIKSLKALSVQAEKLKEEIKNSYVSIKRDYAGSNNMIDVSLNTIGREVEREITYKLSSLLEKQAELIKVTLIKLSADLEVLDEEQSHIINSYVDVAKQYTDELLKIDKNSVLSLEGTRRKMMVIDKLNYDEVSSPRILSVYIKETLNTLILDESLGQDILGKSIMRELSVESLLEHFCDLNSIVVKFYKVEENIHNSDYKKWEEMLPDNSGGEKFVSFFVLLATLINYSRGNHLKKDASSMTIIMDNPFAAISSQHLLIPLFEYAKQNNIQLICFSDHDKVDIVDRFNTIIRLAITPLANKKEIIEAETAAAETSSYDEQIDGGYFSYTEQMKLL